MTKVTINPIFKTLASVKMTLVLLVVFAFACAVATFIESERGTTAARALVYNARWFEVLLALLTLNLIFALSRLRKIWPRRIGYVLMHVAMIVILVGAGITRFLGYEGSMHIREGASANTMLSQDDYIQLRIGDETAAFKTRFYEPGQKLSRQLQLGGSSYRVSVEDFWPHYEEKWIEKEGGQRLLRLTTGGSGNDIPVILKANEEVRAGGVRFWYMDANMLETFVIEPLGGLTINVGQHRANLVVTDKLPVETKVNGFTFTIFEFQGDFKVGQEPGAVNMMTNPMIRVRITESNGNQEERILFAYHPDFDMQHGGRSDSFSNVEMTYRFERALLLADGPDGISARSSLPLLRSGRGGTSQGDTILPGTLFDVPEGIPCRTPGNEFSFVLEEALASAVMAPAPSDNPDAPAAARVRVAEDGTEGVVAFVVRGDDKEAAVEVAGQSAGVSYGRREIRVPYRLHLEDFVLKTYPGSDKPAGYESHVLLFDEEEGVSGKPVRIFMNHPLTHRGFKHFQSSYDRDNRGTILTVNYDPGTIPTYVGYTLLTIGFIFVLLKDVLWPRKPRRQMPKEMELS